MILATCIRSSSGQSIANAPKLQPSAEDWFPYHVMAMTVLSHHSIVSRAERATFHDGGKPTMKHGHSACDTSRTPFVAVRFSAAAERWEGTRLRESIVSRRLELST